MQPVAPSETAGSVATLRSPAFEVRPFLGGQSRRDRIVEAALEVTALGSTTVLFMVLAAVIGYLALEKRWREMGLVVMAAVGGATISTGLKMLIGRPRPAVLIPLIGHGEGTTVVLTQRTLHLRDHAGQISLPGGRIEPGEDPVAAALREAHEEIGLAPAVDAETIDNYGSSLVWGHPQAPMGTRSVIELIEELAIRGGGRGLFAGCAAGDSAMAVVLEVGERK